MLAGCMEGAYIPGESRLNRLNQNVQKFLGIRGTSLNWVVRGLAEEAAQESFWLWLRRKDKLQDPRVSCSRRRETFLLLLGFLWKSCLGVLGITPSVKLLRNNYSMINRKHILK